MIVGNGYATGHAEFALNLLRESPKLRALFDANPSYGYYFMQKLAEVIGERFTSKAVFSERSELIKKHLP